jgi:serine phosphatase RsbU (regulator of sigma subunit)
MLKLRDFVHLPELETLVDRIVSDGPGLIVVAGLDPRPASLPSIEDALLPSGRSAIFNILMQEILEAKQERRAVVVGSKKAVGKAPKHLKRRIDYQYTESGRAQLQPIQKALESKPDLLVIDRLNPENTPLVIEAAVEGRQVLAQMDTVLRGARAVREIQALGASADGMAALKWLIAVQRFPCLCPACRQSTSLTPDTIAHLCSLYPFLKEHLHEAAERAGEDVVTCWKTGSCETCRRSGRRGDLAAFDVFQGGDPLPDLLEKTSLLPMESYLLKLALQGRIALDDLLNLEQDQLRRTYHLLSASEGALNETIQSLNSKIAELDSANRVLLQRTEALVSLQDVSQALIGPTSLEELGSMVCRKAGSLCSADYAILYLFRTAKVGKPEAVVLSVIGWPKDVEGVLVEPELVSMPNPEKGPQSYNRWPPAAPRPPEGKPISNILCGLRAALIAQGQPVGAIIIHTTQKSRFTPGETALLQTIANQVAMAIQRARLVEELRERLTELQAAQAELVKKERLERELELARQVQQSVLPRTFPDYPGFQFAAHNEPARQVGGDFYDVFPLENGHFGLVIGDVSDKGMPAALLMTLTRSLLLAEARREFLPSQVLRNVNRLLIDLGSQRQFVSVFFGVVETSSGNMVYSRAGHDYPLLLRGPETLRLEGQGMVLGMMDDEELTMEERQFQLLPGDRLVLYTDGFTDAEDNDGVFYGIERLERLLRKKVDKPVDEMCLKVFEELKAFRGEVEQYDDMTMLVMGVENLWWTH